METKSHRHIVICVISPKLTLKKWHELNIFETEKERVMKAFEGTKPDLLFYDGGKLSEKVYEKRTKVQLYAPSLYSVPLLVQIFLKLLIHRKEMCSRILRLGYIPSFTHRINKRTWAELKARLLEAMSKIFFTKILLVQGNEHNFGIITKNVTIISQSISKAVLIPMKDVMGQRHKDIIFVGRLEHEKGALAITKFTNRGLSIAMVGDGSLKATLSREPYIEVKGLLDRKKLAELYGLHRFLVNLSPSEGCPKTVIEAACNGCKILYLEHSFKLPLGLEPMSVSFENIDGMVDYLITNNKPQLTPSLYKSIEKIRTIYAT